jgi:hypothetical protein
VRPLAAAPTGFGVLWKCKQRITLSSNSNWWLIANTVFFERYCLKMAVFAPQVLLCELISRSWKMRFEITSKKWLERCSQALSTVRSFAHTTRARAAHTPTISQSLRSACLAGFIALATVSCNAAPKSPPGSGIVVDKDKKPMAGVHVIVWRSYIPARSWWDFGNFVSPISRPSRCHKEHYALSDAQGRFTFPGEVIDRPGEPFTSYIAVGAIKENMIIKHFTPNIEPTSTGLGMADGHQKDYFPKPEKPLEFLVEMESRSQSAESLKLIDLAQMGCSCTTFHRDVDDERERQLKKRVAELKQENLFSSTIFTNTINWSRCCPNQTCSRLTPK